MKCYEGDLSQQVKEGRDELSLDERSERVKCFEWDSSRCAKCPNGVILYWGKCPKGREKIFPGGEMSYGRVKYSIGNKMS